MPISSAAHTVTPLIHTNTLEIWHHLIRTQPRNSCTLNMNYTIYFIEEKGPHYIQDEIISKYCTACTGIYWSPGVQRAS